MSNEWRELKTLQEIAEAQKNGDEIECRDDGGRWTPWAGEYWHTSWKFRARPRQPKMKQVKLLCYFDEFELRWRKEDGIVSVNWVRVPAEDKTIEIPE